MFNGINIALFILKLNNLLEGIEMKKNIKFRHLISIGLVAALFLLMQSCAVYSPYAMEPSVTVQDIVQMSKDNVPAKNIIKEIRKSGSVYLLKADQLAKLRDEGVSDTVINYMEKTHINAVARSQRYNNYGYYGPVMDPYWYGGYGFGYGYPYGYYGGIVGAWNCDTKSQVN